MSNSNDFFWWEKPDNVVHESVTPYIKHLESEQSYRQKENFKFMKMYGNYDLYNLRSYAPLSNENSVSTVNRVTLNIIQSMVDTVTSKIAKNRPKPTFLTEGGNFSQQRRAKKLTQFAEGQFQATDFYAKAAQAFTDSCIFGTGILKIYKEDNEIKVERVFVDEIKVDDRECFYGNPRQLHQTKFIHRDVLKAAFPKFKGLIDGLNLENTEFLNGSQTQNSNMILVTESWHLRSGRKAKDGRHSITISNATLLDERYDKDYFPFVFFRWGLRPLGFFGQGLAEQLQGLQVEINKILRTIQVSMHLVSIPKIFVEAGSKIVDSHIDNKIGGIIKYAGTIPSPGQLGQIPRDLFEHLDRLYNRAYEIAGISQLSANSEKPSGLNSGKALREFNDLETERFMSTAQRYEAVFMDASKQMKDLAKEIDEDLKAQSDEDSKDSEGYKVKVKGKKFIQTIKWSEVEMDEEDFIMSVFPTSALASNPSGRMQDVQELIQAGFVSKEDAMKLLDFPDLDTFYNFANAGLEDIERTIEEFIDQGTYSTPEPYQNLELGITKMQQAYLLFKSQNAPETRLDLFRRWIEDAKAMLDKAALDVQAKEMQAQMKAQQDLDAENAAIAAEEEAAKIAETAVDPVTQAPLDPATQAPLDPMAAAPIDPLGAPTLPAEAVALDSQIPTDVTMPQ